jgi:hypothetical protein
MRPAVMRGSPQNVSSSHRALHMINHTSSPASTAPKRFSASVPPAAAFVASTTSAPLGPPAVQAHRQQPAAAIESKPPSTPVHPNLAAARFVEAKLGSRRPSDSPSAQLLRYQAAKMTFGPAMQNDYNAFLTHHRLPNSTTHRANYLRQIQADLDRERASGEAVPGFDKQVVRTVVTSGFGEPFPAFVGFHPVTQQASWVFDASDGTDKAGSLKKLRSNIKRAAVTTAANSRKLAAKVTAAQQQFERMRQQADDSFYVATGMSCSDQVASTSSSQSS